jgi:hypothetical protein
MPNRKRWFHINLAIGYWLSAIDHSLTSFRRVSDCLSLSFG